MKYWLMLLVVLIAVQADGAQVSKREKLLATEKAEFAKSIKRIGSWIGEPVPSSEVRAAASVSAGLSSLLVTDRELLYCMTLFKMKIHERLPLGDIESVEAIADAVGYRSDGTPIKCPGVKIKLRQSGEQWKHAFKVDPQTIVVGIDSLVTFANGEPVDGCVDDGSQKDGDIAPAKMLAEVLQSKLSPPAPKGGTSINR